MGIYYLFNCIFMIIPYFCPSTFKNKLVSVLKKYEDQLIYNN